jgi:MinD-like ATPase involved in chromosome partitioning or flagellar assembly
MNFNTLHDLISRLKKLGLFDYIFIDLTNHLTHLNIQLLNKIDLIFYILTNDSNHIQKLSALKSMIKIENKDEWLWIEKCKYVINKHTVDCVNHPMIKELDLLTVLPKVSQYTDNPISDVVDDLEFMKGIHHLFNLFNAKQTGSDDEQQRIFIT